MNCDHTNVTWVFLRDYVTLGFLFSWILNVCVFCLHMYVCGPGACLVLMEVKKGNQIP